MIFSEPSKGLVYALLAFSSWGLFPLVWKRLSFLSTDEILGHRVIWTFLWILVYFLLIKKDELKLNFSSIKESSYAALFLGANWMLFIYGVNSNQIIELSLGYYLAPILHCCFGALVFQERYNRHQLLGLLFCFSGVMYKTLTIHAFPLLALSVAMTFVLYGV